MASEDQMLPIHKIDEELMPAVLNQLSGLKSSIPETNKSVLKYLDWIENDLVGVRDAIGTLKETERLLNVQMKELVCVLNDISEKQARMDSTRSESDESLPEDMVASVESSEHSIRQRQIEKELSKLDETVPKLKETLNLNGGFNLRSYVESKDEMLAIHKIDDELMPAVLNHVSKLKSSIPETHDRGLKDLDGFRNDLIDVRDAIRSLKGTERLLNDQMRELVCVNLNDISHEMDAMVEERQRAALMVFMGSEFDELFVWHDDGSEPEPSDSLDNPKSSDDQIENELAQLHKTLPNLKETLNLIPKFSPSANEKDTNIQNPSSANPSEETIEHGINVFTSFAETLHRPLLSTLSHRSAFKEIRILYESLDIRLKLCLLCFSAFPDNSVINKRILTYWWIGEGFVESLDRRTGKTAENTADEIFQELMANGFIEPVYRKRFPVVHRYKMHPFIRFMVVILAQKAGFFDIDTAGNFLSHSAKSLKACLVRTKDGSSQNALRDIPELKKLDTLFNVNESYLDLQSHWFSKLKMVKILQLGRWQSSMKHHIEVSNTDFLKNLSNMKYLKYLSLQGISRIPELPVSFSNLSNMRVLDFKACHNLQKLPDGIGMLKNLTHLDMSECYLIGHMPQELALLIQLEVLKGFIIGETNSAKHDVCSLTELSQCMKKLRKLSLYITGHPNVTKGELFDKLPHFTALCSLTIAWVGVPLPATIQSSTTGKPRSKGRYTADAEATNNNIKSLGNLEKLDLRCFPWTEMAAPLDPMELRSLKKLYIRGGELCDLHHMDHPWNVEMLRLKYLCKLRMSWEKLQVSFPQLIYLEKVSCPKLSLFPCDGDGVWMKNHLV